MDENMVKLKCLHCSQSGNTEFHEIFDDNGIDLQLDALLQEHFNLFVTHNPTEQQVLCGQCVNELIELFDESEREKEEHGQNGACKVMAEDTDTLESETEVKHSSDDIEWECTTNLEVSTDDLEEFFESEENVNIPIIASEEGDIQLETIAEKELFTSFPVVDLEIYDNIDLNSYADSIINSNLEEIQLKRETQCNICLDEFKYHQELLDHIKLHHVNTEGHFLCPFENCNTTLENFKILARHIILKHYDLCGISIFGACPDCEKTFSNFLDFNKHSCCRTLKNKGKILNYCKYCRMEFPTFRKLRFHLQFHMAKRRPKVCLLCDQSFSNVEKFFQHVHYEHEPAHRQICIECDRVFNNKSLYKTHLAKHKLSNDFKCHHCGKSFDHHLKLKSHMELHHYNNKPLKCDICCKDFTTKKNYRNHQKSHEPFADVQVNVCVSCGLIGRDIEELLKHQKECNCFEKQIDEEILNEVFVCEYCELSFKTRSHLKAHRATGIHVDKVFHCPFCSTKFNELRKLRVHLNSHKMFAELKNSLPLLRQYMCDADDCEYSSPIWMTLNSHRLTKHKELQLICDKCNKQFNNQVDFDAHRFKHQKDGKFNCQFCEKQCPTKMSLSVHIARSHNNKKVKCSTCKACFKDEETLQKHIDFEHEEMECDLCYKRIKNKRNLVLHHRIVHLNKKRFFCEICAKGFFNKSDMAAHKKTVHPSTSFKCSECSFETNYEKSIEIHMARHNFDFKFKCIICGKEFTRENVLKLHMKRHQTKREFMCSKCDASFITRWLLKRHFSKNHLNNENYKLSHTKQKQKKFRNVINEPIVSDGNDEAETTEFSNFDTYIAYEDENCDYVAVMEEINCQNDGETVLEITEESF